MKLNISFFFLLILFEICKFFKHFLQVLYGLNIVLDECSQSNNFGPTLYYVAYLQHTMYYIQINHLMECTYCVPICFCIVFI